MINLNIDSKNIIIAISIAVGVVVIGIIIYVIFSRNIHIKKHVNEIIKRYDKIHNLLSVQLYDELKRVNSIAQANIEYEHIYAINNDAYKKIMSQEDAVAHSAINELNRLLTDKKYKNLKEQIEVAKESVNKLEIQYDKLADSLSQIVNVDEENRQEILRYRRQFREIRERFDSKKNELKYIESSFTAVFDKLEQYFIDSEKLLSAAHYEESKEKFPEIEKVIEALDKAIDILPKLVTLTYVVIPNSIVDLQNTYNDLTNKGYPLHHLKVQSSLEYFNSTLENIKVRLVNFQSKNVEYELFQIRDAIIKMAKDFDDEVKSKEYFNLNYDKIYNGSYEIENKFIKLKRLIPNYKGTYILKDTSMDDLEKIQSDINNLGTIKRTLDNYVHSSSQQPYSNLSKRLRDLSDAMDVINNDITGVHTYLSSLKVNVEEAYKYIADAYIILKDYESELRQINVNDLFSRFKSVFNQSYAYINQIGEIAQRLPIDVESIKQNLIPLKDNIKLITEQMKNLTDEAKKAEESIVRANVFKEGFYDARTGILKAEKAFFEGDFIRAWDESLNVIKKNLPETGK